MICRICLFPRQGRDDLQDLFIPAAGAGWGIHLPWSEWTVWVTPDME